MVNILIVIGITITTIAMTMTLTLGMVVSRGGGNGCLELANVNKCVDVELNMHAMDMRAHRSEDMVAQAGVTPRIIVIIIHPLLLLVGGGAQGKGRLPMEGTNDLWSNRVLELRDFAGEEVCLVLW